MCCPTGSGCGCCSGPNHSENGAVGGGRRSLEETAKELGSAALLVRGFFHSGGNWVEIVDSIRHWERERVGHCIGWMSNLVRCFSNCGGDDGAVSGDELNAILQVLCAQYGVPTVCLVLERLAGALEEICRKSKVEVEEILSKACDEASLDIQELQEFCLANQGGGIETAVRHGSLTDPNVRNPVQLCRMIQRVCGAAGVTGVITEPPHRIDDASGSNSTRL